MELITYHLPTFVKHVLAPKNEFGITKMTWRNYKSFGIRANPPPPMLGQIPKKCRFFFYKPPKRWGHGDCNAFDTIDPILQLLQSLNHTSWLIRTFAAMLPKINNFVAFSTIFDGEVNHLEHLHQHKCTLVSTKWKCSVWFEWGRYIVAGFNAHIWVWVRGVL